jgi:hypothetical protein
MSIGNHPKYFEQTVKRYTASQTTSYINIMYPIRKESLRSLSQQSLVVEKIFTTRYCGIPKR